MEENKTTVIVEIKYQDTFNNITDITLTRSNEIFGELGTLIECFKSFLSAAGFNEDQINTRIK